MGTVVQRTREWLGAPRLAQASLLVAAAVVAFSASTAGLAARLRDGWTPELAPLPYYVSLHLPPVPAAPAPQAAPLRAPWQSPDVARSAFPQAVERWRPVVRELLAEAWDEGRLDGKAATLDEDLVLAVIQHESSGNPNARSWAGAIGLMQVMPFTFAEMHHGHASYESRIDRAAFWDVRSNVRAGIRYLALAMQAHEGNVYWALASYNAGIETVGIWRAAGLYAVPPVGGYTETAAYAPNILRTYLRSRPGLSVHIPDPMPAAHVPGALRQIREAEQRLTSR